jgi:hypothetical protein
MPNLFITFLASVLVGTLLGIPAGTVVGTIVGHFKAKNLACTTDIVDEGMRPYIIGLLLPFLFLATALPLWIFWLTPQMAGWLS